MDSFYTILCESHQRPSCFCCTWTTKAQNSLHIHTAQLVSLLFSLPGVLLRYTLLTKCQLSSLPASLKLTLGEFNNASARRALVDWYLSLFIMCKAWHQYNERPRALALLNLPQVNRFSHWHNNVHPHSILTLCLLGTFACFCRLLIFFFQINFFEKFFQDYHPSIKHFRSRSGPTFCQAWSGLSADNTSEEWVNPYSVNRNKSRLLFSPAEMFKKPLWQTVWTQIRLLL